MKSIALLGTSGVGKTFLYERLFENENNRAYMSVYDACIKAAGNVNTNFGFNWRYLYRLLLRSRLLVKKEYGLSRKLLLHPEADWGKPQDYHLSFSLLKKYLVNESSQEVVAKRIENFKKCIQLHAALEDNLNHDEVVVFDEGALHYHHGLERSITSNYPQSEIKRDKALNPSAVIFLELPFEMHMSRIIHRKNQGINTFSHGKLIGKELESYVERNIAAYNEKIETLKILNIPILPIDAGQDLKENLKQIDVFIKNLN